MSEKANGHKPPDKQEKKKGGKNASLYFFVAAGVLALCWFYFTTWAPLQIDPKHSEECLLYKGVAWVVASPAHKLVFGVLLALPLLLGATMKRWAIGYFRMVTVLALVAVAITAWDLSSSVDYFTSLVDRLLNVNFFDRST